VPVENQVIALFAGGKGYLDDLDVDKVQAFRDGLIEYVHGSYADVLKTIVDEQKISDDTEAKLKKVIGEYKGIFSAEHVAEGEPAVETGAVDTDSAG
jgi:F-type H+-transporting ATPase subunit alpha